MELSGTQLVVTGCTRFARYFFEDGVVISTQGFKVDPTSSMNLMALATHSASIAPHPFENGKIGLSRTLLRERIEFTCIREGYPTFHSKIPAACDLAHGGTLILSFSLLLHREIDFCLSE